MVIEFLLENWVYGFIPIVSGLVGWATNVVALRMTFYPLEFTGIPPYLGWQGIIPANAGVMAGKAVDLLTKNLIKIEDQFENVDFHRVVEEMGPELERVSHKIIDEVMHSQAPSLWVKLPNTLKDQLYLRVKEELPITVGDLMKEINVNISELLDLRGLVVSTLLEDRKLLNSIFLKCGEKEFVFIERSGAYFGFAFGIIQMLVWFHFQPWWLLPVAGLTVGFITNWLALRLIFKPEKPWIVGKYRVQGLFIKRQKEVSIEYAKIVANQILTSPTIFDSIFFGSRSGEVSSLIRKHVTKVVDMTVGSSKDFVTIIVGSKKYEIIKNIAYSGFMEDLRIIISRIFNYADEALDLENTLREKMQALPPWEFVGFLRPIFEEDEWKLISVGAILGGLAGLAQLYLLF